MKFDSLLALVGNQPFFETGLLLAGDVDPAHVQRPYIKGRDLYDLIWYLSDRNWPAPNLTLLNHALAQTDWGGPNLTLENWHGVVSRRIEAVSFEQASMDVRPFLASDEDIKLVSRENLLGLLK